MVVAAEFPMPSKATRRSFAARLLHLGLILDLSEAEDLLQDTWLNIRKSGERPDSIKNADAYFWTALFRLAIDRLHYRNRHPQKSLECAEAQESVCLDSPTDGPSALALTELLGFLWSCILDLPFQQSKTVSAWLLNGRSVEEIARAGGKQLTSVYELLEKGLKKLQDALAGHPDYREFALARDHGARRSNAESARRPA